MNCPYTVADTIEAGCRTQQCMKAAETVRLMTSDDAGATERSRPSCAAPGGCHHQSRSLSHPTPFACHSSERLLAKGAAFCICCKPMPQTVHFSRPRLTVQWCMPCQSLQFISSLLWKSSWSPAPTDGLELGGAAAGFGAVEGPAGASLGFPL